MMYLVKSLQEKHREATLKAGHVRIGTINYYRQIEDETRADGEEGLGKIVWCGEELKQEHFNKIFSPFDDIQMINGWTIKNNGMPIHGSYPNFNAFVYCYSEVETTDDIAAASGGKGESYVCIAKPARFVALVREELKPIIIRAIEKHAPHEEKEQILKTLEILDVNYRVNYDDQRKDRMVDESNVEDFNPMAFHPQDFFQKATSYSYEREVRTLWLPIAIHPLTGREVPLNIPHNWQHEDIDINPDVFSSTLIEHRLDLKTSGGKSQGV